MLQHSNFSSDADLSPNRSTCDATNSHQSMKSPLPYKIPFNKPSIVGQELAYITESLASGSISGDGSFTQRSSRLLKETLKCAEVLLTTSCTHALEMAALLLDIQPGDEVIVPSFTFVSTINAFVLRGATPIFIDIRPDTLNLNEEKLEGLITERTKAIIPVHYAGVGCEMDTILDVSVRHGIPIVEDNAHGLFGQYQGRYLGTFGCLATQSFHETKNFSCGEGGALIINDPQFVERAEIIREKGTNRTLFYRGQVDKYSWVDIGSSYLPSDVLAAILLAQLEKRKEIQAQRKRIWMYYYSHLQDWAQSHYVKLPTVPSHCDQAYHMFYLVMPSLESRQALIAHLKEQGIMSVFHYLPLHLSTFGKQYGGWQGQFPVTERVSDCLLRLPFYNSLTEEEQKWIVSVVQNF